MKITDSVEKKFISSSFFVLLGKAALIPLAMLQKIILARMLGPQDFGLYILFLRICDFTGMLSLLGTKTATIKMVGIAAGAKKWGKVRGVLRSVARIVAVSSMLMGVALLFVKYPLGVKVFNSRELSQMLVFCIAMIPLQNGFAIIEELFKGLQDLKAASLLPVLRYFIQIAFVSVLWFAFDASMNDVLFVLCLGLFISLVTGLLFFQRNSKKWPPGIEHVKPSCILTESLPMMITSGTVLIMSSTDVYVLGIFTNPHEVGIYGVVNSLAMVTILSLSVINYVIPAMIAHYNEQKDYKTLAYIIRFASTTGAMATIPAFIIVLFFGKYVLSFLFGPQYSSGATALTFLVTGQLIRALCGSSDYFLQMTGMHVQFMKISLATAVLNLTLNLALVQYYGKEGVAAATSASLIVQNLSSLTLVYRKKKIWTPASLDIAFDILRMAKDRLFTFLGK